MVDLRTVENKRHLTVATDDLIVVLEAMKMEQPLTAHRAGTVTGLSTAPGDTVSAGAALATTED